jgi:DNA repair exonuclease SbcCD ATPase subunit
MNTTESRGFAGAAMIDEPSATMRASSAAEVRRLRGEAERLELLVALENSERASMKAKEEYFREVSVLTAQMYEIEAERTDLRGRLAESEEAKAAISATLAEERGSWSAQLQRSGEQCARLEAAGKATAEQAAAEAARCSDLQARQKKLQAEKTELEQLLRESEEGRNRARDMHDAILAEMTKKESEVESRISTLEGELEQALAEKATLHKVVSIRESCFEAERREIDRRMEMIKRREEQLKKYADTLNEEKQAMRRTSLQLGREVQASVALHPLKDCLAFTETELDRVETQLRKTPMISVERPKLEETVKQLVEQRRFLRTLIDSAAQQAERQAHALGQMTGAGALAAVPPPLPLADV